MICRSLRSLLSRSVALQLPRRFDQRQPPATISLPAEWREWGPGARSHRKDLFKEKGQIELELLRRHQSGDTLASISRKFYKSPKRWEEILDANKESIRNPGNLKVGQTLIIP